MFNVSPRLVTVERCESLLKSIENLPDGLTVKDPIDVEGSEYKRVVYKRLRALVEGFIGRVKCMLEYGWLSWQGLEKAGIHVNLGLEGGLHCGDSRL